MEAEAGDKVKDKDKEGGGQDNPENGQGPMSVGIVDDPELEDLLNDAIKDFGKVPKITPNKKGPVPSTSSGSGEEMNQVWTEEFIKEATTQFEKKIRECLQTQGQSQGPLGLGQGASSSPSCSGSSPGSNELNKVVEAATKAAVGGVCEPSAIMGQINAAMNNLKVNPSSSNSGRLGGPQGQDPFGDDEFAKFMNSFGMGGGDDSELEDLLPFMTNFMQKLLSKDLLYPVLSDIVDRYPDWLGDNRQKLPSADFDKYNKQYEYMKLICQEYAAESPADSEETKRKRFDKISELMVKVQCLGSPPKDLIGEDTVFPNMNPTAAMAELGGLAGASGSDQCSIM